MIFMRENINELVSVVCYFNASKRSFKPYLVCWHNKDYKIGEIGYHHEIRVGVVLHHIYECVDVDRTIWFRLNFNTLTLNWRLEVTSDGFTT